MSSKKPQNSNNNFNVENKILEKNGYNIHYYISGKEENRLLIFLHPAFSDHRIFDLQIQFFSKLYRVITVDLIGHGLSKISRSDDKIDASADHINEIISIEGYSCAHIAGCSMGSLIAQHFALVYPDKTESLVILGGYDINCEDKEISKAQGISNITLIIRALFSIKSFRKKVAEISTATPEGEAVFFESATLYERSSFKVMMGFRNIIKNRDTPEPAYPLLVATGEHDIPLAHRASEKLKKRYRDCTGVVIKSAGHCANTDQPEEFNRILLGFLQKI